MGIEFSETGSKFFFYFVFIFSAINAGIAANQYRANKYISRFFVLLAFVILFIPLGFRSVAIDHGVYKEWYDHADYWLRLNYHLTPEPLFAWLTLFAKYVAGSFQLIYLFSAFVYLAGVFVFLRKSESFGYLSVFFMSISLYLYMCGLARISIAIGIVSYAFTVLERKYKPLILILIACFFHYSSIITVLVYISYKNKRNVSFKNILYIIVGMLTLSFIINRFGEVLPYAIMRYAGYVELSFCLGNITSVVILLPALILWGLFKGGYKALYKEKYVFYDNIVKIVFGLICLSLLFNGVFRLAFFYYPIIAKIYFDFRRVLAITNQGAVVPMYTGLFSVVGLVYVSVVFYDSPFITNLIIPFSM